MNVEMESYGSDFILDVSRLDPGVYFLKVKRVRKYVCFRKFLKQISRRLSSITNSLGKITFLPAQRFLIRKTSSNGMARGCVVVCLVEAKVLVVSLPFIFQGTCHARKKFSEF